MTFEQLGRILIKRWGLVLICFLLAGLGAYIGTTKFVKPLYQSSVVIEVVVRSGGDPLVNDNIMASQQLAVTEAQLATSGQVLDTVVARYPGLTADDLAKEVTAAPKDNTQLFEIDVLDPSPTRAANIANDIAATLIKLQTQVTKPTPTPTAAPAPGTATQGATTQGAATQNNFLVIAQSARPATTPARPNKLIYVGAGLLIGLLLGIVLALLLEPLDTRVRTKEVLARLLGWPVLGTLNQVPRSEAVINPMGYNSNAEAYGTLHMNLGFAAVDKPLHTLVVTSATPGDGKSTVAANLAIFMARSGRSTLLIDANLRHPILHEQFGIPAYAMGFSNAMLAFRAPRNTNTGQRQQLTPAVYSGAPGVTGELTLDSFLRPASIPNLYIMPSGPLPPNPPELLDSKAMQRFFVALSKCGVEVVIFDAPALLGLPDAAILASKADATLVVVDVTRARKKELTQVKVALEQAAAHVIGCVINKQRRSKDVPYKNTPYSYYHSLRMQNNRGRSNTNTKITNVSAALPVPPQPVIAEPSRRQETPSLPQQVPQATPKPQEAASRSEPRERRDEVKDTPAEALVVTQKRRDAAPKGEPKEQSNGATDNRKGSSLRGETENVRERTDETVTLPTVKKRETGE